MNMTKNPKFPIKIRSVRVAVYVLLYVINIIAYGLLDSYFLLFIGIFMTIFPIVSIGMVVYLKHKLQLHIVVPDGEITKGQVSKVKLTLLNNSIGMSLQVRVHIQMENTFYENLGEMSLTVPVMAKSQESRILPIKVTLCGGIEIRAYEIEIQDLLGFITLRKEIQEKSSIRVYPLYQVYEVVKSNDVLQGITESEESKGRGNDFSEVSSIREYIKGDRRKDIHWKLSAKKGVLMVKERVNLSGDELLVLLELRGLPQQIEEVLSYGYAICKHMITGKIPVTLMWYDGNQRDFIQHTMIGEKDPREAFKVLYHTKVTLQEVSNDTLSQMKLLNAQTKRFVYVHMEQGKVEVNVIENE